jgi:nucleotide-binding universal stress UspA family protein
MYKHILIPTDGSELSKKAIEHGLEMAKQLGAKVTAMSVRVPFYAIAVEGVSIPVPQETQKEIVAQVQRDLDAIAGQAKAAGVTCDTVQIENAQPWAGIIDTAGERGCDLIVMASHGRRGVSALLLGSETQKVLTHSKVPVLVYR